jgi:hypothetical protein
MRPEAPLLHRIGGGSRQLRRSAYRPDIFYRTFESNANIQYN